VEAIDHVDLVVSSFERSTPFYRGLLGLLGPTREEEIVGERGERVVYFIRPGALGAVGLRERQSPGEPYDRYSLGLHHLALAAPDREAVDRVGAWAGEEGVEIESGPGEYDYTPGYYAIFLRDPDGLKREVVHR
jgi:glyoxylase I family protein